MLRMQQDLPPVEKTEKEHTKMDSQLARIYKAAASGDPLSGSASAHLSPDGKSVQIILEMASADSPVPGKPRHNSRDQL